MNTWTYIAVPLRDSDAAPVQGMLTATGESDARAMLRRAGLQPIRLRRARGSGGSMACRRDSFFGLANAFADYRRGRRVAQRAELADSLATMLEAGVTLAEAIHTAGRATGRRGLAPALAQLEHAIAEGSSLGAAMAMHRSWFDEVECAMVEAGTTSGDLVGSLRAIAARLERRAAVGTRLAAILTYPALVACVGIGVVAFLGTRTLPQLASVLTESGVAVPRLTIFIMAIGSSLASWGWVMVLAIPLSLLLLMQGSRRSPAWREALDRAQPRLVRTIRVASVARTLGDLLGTGVPLVEALRVASPMAGSGLGRCLDGAAARVEQGEDLGSSFGDPRWFDAESIRVLELAQHSGDLGPALAHLAQRAERRADRAVAALASVLEPAVILALAALVGAVVMAAVMPLLRLQEVV